MNPGGSVIAHLANSSAGVPLEAGEPWPVLEYEPGAGYEVTFPVACPGLASAVLTALVSIAASLGWTGRVALTVHAARPLA